MTEAITSLVFDSKGEVDGHRAGVEAAKKHRDALGRFIKTGKESEDTAKGAGDAYKKAATQLDKLERQTRLAAKIQKDWNVSAATARRVARSVEGEQKNLTATMRAQAVAIDRAEKEMRELTAAQRDGRGISGAFAGAMRGVAAQLLAVLGAATLVRGAFALVSEQLKAGFADFTALEDAVVSLRKVTDQLTETTRAGLVQELQDLSTSTVPVATESLIEYAAAAGQLGIESAEGLKLAATIGAQLAEATDLAGDAAIRGLTRILAIQGESIDSLDNIGSSLAKLGNTSKLTEAEIQPIANEIARSTANFKIGSPVILGFAAALGETGAKAEGTGTAIAQLFRTLLKAAVTGEGLEELARVANVSTDRLAELAKEDIGGAALVFLQGLNRFGQQGAIALEQVGLSSQRTAKGLLPLAANVDRLRNRLEVSAQAFEENTALADEAEAAFDKLSADVLRAENAFKLLRGEVLSGLAPAMSTLLRETAAVFVQWRAFLEELKATPVVAAAGTVAIGLLNAQIRQTAENLTTLPRLLAALGSVSLTNLVNALERMAELPAFLGGAGFTAAAASVREVRDSLSALAAAGVDGAEAADLLATEIPKVDTAADGAAASLETFASSARDVRAEIEKQIQTQKDLIRLTGESWARTEDLAKAQQLMADKFKGTFDEALALARQLRILQEAAENLAAVERLDLLPRFADQNLPSGVDPDAVDLGGPSNRENLGAVNFGAKLNEAMAFAGDEFEAQMIGIGVDFGKALLAGGAELSSFLQSAIPSVFESIGQAAGSAFGPVGAIGGGLLGSVLGEILQGLFKRGADEAVATLEVVGQQLTAFADSVEGDLGPALDSMARGVIESVNLILAEFGGTIEAGRFGFKIRQGEVVRVYYEGLTAEFEDEAAAASFLVAKILSASMISGLSASVEEALKGGDFGSVEELLTALDFARQVDELLLTPLQLALEQSSAEARVFLQTAAELGINMDRATAAMVAQTQAQLDQRRAAALVAAGVDAMVFRFEELKDELISLGPDAIAKLEDELEDAAEKALAAAAAASSMGTAFDGSEASFNDFIRSTGLAGEEADRLRDRFDELVRAGTPAEEIVSELVVSLRGMSSAEIRTAIQQFRTQFMAGLLSSLADLADRVGNTTLAARLRARAEELQSRFQLIGIRLMLREAEVRGLLNATVAANIRGFIQQIQRDFNEVLRTGGFAPPASGGGGGGNRQAEADRAEQDRLRAAEQFDEAVRSLQDAIEGVTPRMRAFRDQLAAIEENGRLAGRGAEEVARASAMLAEVFLLGLAAPFEEAARQAGETDAATRFREIGQRAILALAEAAEAEAANPGAFDRAAAAILAGLDAELEALGQDLLGGFSNAAREARRAGRDAVRSIRFMLNHLDELGLSAEQVGRIVRGSLLPGLLETAIREAERVGDFERAQGLRERALEIERQLARVQLASAEAQLRAAGMYDDAIRGIIEGIRRDLDRPDFAAGGGSGGGGGGSDREPTGSDRFRPRLNIPDFGGKSTASRGGSASAGETLAEILAEIAGENLTPLERIERQWAAIRDRIAAVTATEVERTEALRIAELKLAEARAELQDGIRDLIGELTSGGLSGLSEEDRLAALTAQARQLATEGPGSAEELERVVRDALGLIGSVSAGERQETGARRADLLALLQSSLGAGGGSLPAVSTTLPPPGLAQGFGLLPPSVRPGAGGAETAGLRQEISALRNQLVEIGTRQLRLDAGHYAKTEPLFVAMAESPATSSGVANAPGRRV